MTNITIRNKKGQFEKGNGRIDFTGQRLGRLTVISIAKNPKYDRKTYWLCVCDCGNKTIIRSDSLGKTLSCGCLKKEKELSNLGITYNHNTTHHKLFHIWNGIMSRCYNKNQKSYSHYGARGIKVCEQWKNPINFLLWADKTYIDGYSIERINVNEDYSPNNCTWIPLGKQASNTTKSVYIIINGEKDNITHWAKRLHTTYKRLRKIYANELIFNT